MSEWFQVLNGVQQGNVMSQKLFTIYGNDLSILLIISKVGCEINEVSYRFCVQHVIAFNPLNSIYIVFKPNHFSFKCPSAYLGDDKVASHERVKYLSVFVRVFGT